MLTEKIIQFKVHSNSSGNLCVYESGDKVPFDIKRIFTVTAKKNEIRGNHSHKICKQLLVCVSGEIEVTCDDGLNQRIYRLSEMGKGLLIPAGIWAFEKYINEGSVLMVLCDQAYEKDDYIFNYEEFKKTIRIKIK